jgi:hypothetical protein
VIAALFVVVPASAGAIPITFDGLPAGTEVSAQFAADGVVFLPGPTHATGLPVVANVGGNASSQPMVADSQCIGCEFVPHSIAAQLLTKRETVTLRTGIEGAPADPQVTIVLDALDAGFNVIATSQVTVTPGTIHNLITVDGPGHDDVAYFRLSTLNNALGTIGMDDITYTGGGAGAPDVSLTVPASDVNLLKGLPRDIPVTITRFDGSNGDVTMSASGLPAGVTATFTPPVVTGPATTIATMHLTAGAAAALSNTPVTVTITGTPANVLVAPAPRSTSINLVVKQAFTLRSAGSTDADVTPCVATVPLEVDRDFGFPGPVDLTVTGMSAGVQASFSPPQATFPNGSAGEPIALVVTGPPSGFAVPPQTLTVHASFPTLPEQTLTVTVHGTCPAPYDVRITSMQVTQGTQSTFLPGRNTIVPSASFAYDDIPDHAQLVGGGTTVVRVYANEAFGPATGIPNVTAQLRGFGYDRFGQLKELAGGPVMPVSGPRTLLPGPASATTAEEISAGGAFSFVLPTTWTHGSIQVSVTLVVPPVGSTPQSVQQCSSTACIVDDGFGIGHIPFTESPTVTIQPVAMTISGRPALPDAATVFQWARLMTPLPLVVQPYVATLDITDLAGEKNGSDQANEDVVDRLDDYDCDHVPGDRSWHIGVNTGLARGVTHPHLCFWEFAVPDDAVVEWQRPLSSVAHEWFHLLGRPHASYGCGGGDNGQTAEHWPPDELGYLQSVGLDVNMGSGTGGPFAVIGGPLSSKNWFDFMSYCGSAYFVTNPLTDVDWISVHNWNAVLNKYRYRSFASVARAGATTNLLRVTGFVTAAGAASVATVRPVTVPKPPGLTDGANYTVVGRNAQGAVVAQAVMRSGVVHAENGPPLLALLGYLTPSPAIAKVEIVHSGTVAASRSASAHAPSVAILSPRKGRRTHGANVSIRLHAADADGGPLSLQIAYSRDDGRTWQVVFSGPAARTVKLPGRLLGRSSKARLRVSASDGFNVTTVVSGRFRADGAPPSVSITLPAKSLRQRADAPVTLRGQAFDDAGRLLAGKQLRWLDGKRLLGTGASLTVAGLAPGRHRIALVARDAARRSARATVTVTLGAVRPAFLILRAPPTLGRKVRVLKLRVASSLRATLTVRAPGRRTQRFSVGRRAKVLRIAVRPGTSVLKLRLSLKAGRLALPAVVTVKRK